MRRDIVQNYMGVFRGSAPEGGAQAAPQSPIFAESVYCYV